MLIQVELSKIIIDEKRQDQIIVLKEKKGDRLFPIVIGFLEASSIKMKLSCVETPRPMTHDLIVAVMRTFEGKVQKLIIDKMVNNTFHAKLEVAGKDGQPKMIDCRPSDGMAVAVRTEAPIFVDEEVLKNVELFKGN